MRSDIIDSESSMSKFDEEFIFTFLGMLLVTLSHLLLGLLVGLLGTVGTGGDWIRGDWVLGWFACCVGRWALAGPADVGG
jgi:hypothetical protein